MLWSDIAAFRLFRFRQWQELLEIALIGMTVFQEAVSGACKGFVADFDLDWGYYDWVQIWYRCHCSYNSSKMKKVCIMKETVFLLR